MKLGTLKFDTTEYASRANAVLGIRDSGKTYTATGLAEQLLDAKKSIPFIVFDPTGVWRYLRVPGAGKGYPVVVVGGNDGDLPLKAATAGKIVEAALRGNASLVFNLSGGNITKGEMRKIVTDCVSVLMDKNPQYGLRHVFIEEAAEFVPQRINDGIVYAAVEKLVRVGGNMGLGVTLVNPRTQNLNKEVLELCDNIFLHRQKGTNSLKHLQGWFDAVGAGAPKEMVQSISKLKSGECFAWLRDMDEPQLVHVQQKNSFHPNRRDLQALAGKKVKRVDAAELISALKHELPQVEAEMNANDPALLRAEIERLKKLKPVVVAAPAAAPVPKIDTKAIKDGAFKQGVEAGQKQADRQIAALTKLVNRGVEAMQRKISTILAGMARNAKAVEDGLELLKAAAKEIEGATGLKFPELEAEMEKLAKVVTAGASIPALASPALKPAAAPRSAPPLPPADGDEYTTQERKVLEAMAALEHMSVTAPSREQVAIMADYHINTGKFQGAITSLKARGIIGSSPLGAGLVMAAANPFPVEAPLTVEGIKERVCKIWSDEAQLRTFNALYDAPEEGLTRHELAAAANYHINTGKHQAAVTKMKKLGMIVDKPGNRMRLAEWVYGR